MKKLLLKIKAWHDRHPYLSTSGIYFVLYGGGEFSSQSIKRLMNGDITNEDSIGLHHHNCEVTPDGNLKFKYDWRTVAAVGFVGATYFAPFSLWWYRWLDKYVPGFDRRSIFKKIILNQIVAGLPAIPVFYGATSALQGYSVEESWDEVKDKFVPTWMTGMVYWPGVQAVNFMMVPTAMKPLYVGFFSYVWTNIICLYKTVTFSDKILVQVVA